MVKISAYIVTLNEEKRLGKTLQALKKVADEIFVIDSGSTDKTQKIAEKYGAKFLFHKWKNISAQKHYGQELCHNDWVLSLDADEVLSPELIADIKEKKPPQPMLIELKSAICFREIKSRVYLPRLIIKCACITVKKAICRMI